MTSKNDLKTEAKINPKSHQKDVILEVIFGGPNDSKNDAILGAKKGCSVILSLHPVVP